jgi:hypothetical protein
MFINEEAVNIAGFSLVPSSQLTPKATSKKFDQYGTTKISQLTY